MKYTHIIIRYGELTTKGKNRKEFTSMLLTNLKKSLSHFPSLEYDRQHDRMFIALNDEDPKAVADGISKIFGLSSYSLALKTSTDLDSLKAAALEIIDDGDYKTFKVKTKRQDKNYPMISVGRDTGTRELYILYFLKHHLYFQPELEASSTDQLLPMVEYDLGIAFYPEMLAQDAIQRHQVIQLQLHEQWRVRYHEIYRQ